MKKIFTLIGATFLTVASFAADNRRPSVTLKSSGNYEVIIDGQSYTGRNAMMNLTNIRKGQHSIKVYEISRSPFRKIKKLVSASSFEVKKTDVTISVDYRGQISIFQDKFGNGKGNGWDDRSDRNDKNDRNDRNDRDKRDNDRRF